MNNNKLYDMFNFRGIIMTRIFFLLILTTVINSCEEEFSPFVSGLESKSIADILYENETQYSDFIQLMENAGLMDALSAYNPINLTFTVFVPNNDAFNEFFAQSSHYKSLNELLADSIYADALARYHVVITGIRSNDFPFGALPESTLTGDYLSVGFSQGLDSTIYLINNFSPVTRKNIGARNGFIHQLGAVLEPVVWTGYDWLKANPEYSIFISLLELTNVKDRMGYTITGPSGLTIPNNYTVFAEADSIFNKRGIPNLEALIGKVSPDRSDFTSEDNPLYQFAAYHILEGAYFLDRFEGTLNYNTFGSLPIRIQAGAKLRINPDPNRILDTVYIAEDTIYINFLEPIYNHSNILTKNGAIHLLNYIMYVHKPSISIQTFEFFEEPYIDQRRNAPNTYVINDQKILSVLSWSGSEQIIYYKASAGIAERALNRDYIRIEGDFEINYKIPRVLPGRYAFYVQANSFNADNAIIEVFIDGRKIGGNVNLTSGATSGQPYRKVKIGLIDFQVFETHTITVRSLLPGIFTWDYISFEPSS